MLIRFLLTLMLAFGATPTAAQPCHDAMPMAASHEMTDRGSGHAPGKAMLAHVCIGCTLPSNWQAKRFAAPALSPLMPPVARITTLDALGRPPPALPPPRIG